MFGKPAKKPVPPAKKPAGSDKPQAVAPKAPAKPAKPSAPAPKPAATPTSPPATEQPKVKILIIDDDVFMSGMYSTRLLRDGFEVVTATDGMLGIQKAKSEKPDVILCDVLMPLLDGFETLTRLKADPQTAAIPVMMLTSMGQKEDVDRGLKAGAADYMVKTNTLPVDASDKIKKLIGRAK
jgi:CheY-like chemotaxis protein